MIAAIVRESANSVRPFAIETVGASVIIDVRTIISYWLINPLHLSSRTNYTFPPHHIS